MRRLLEMDVANWGVYSPEWEVKRDKIVMNRKLGEGAFGTVYGGEALLLRDRRGRGETGAKAEKKRNQHNGHEEEWVSYPTAVEEWFSYLTAVVEWLSYPTGVVEWGSFTTGVVKQVGYPTGLVMREGVF